MAEVVALTLEDGSKVLFEAADADVAFPSRSADGAYVKVARDDVVDRSVSSFEGALNAVRPAINAVMALAKEMAPSSCQIEFGLKASVTAFLFIAAGSGANIKVTVTWNKDS